MESRVSSKISYDIRRKQSAKRKFKNKRNANKVTNEFNDQTLHLITEYDESERLCLPNANSFVQTNSRIDQVYPKHYNVNEYENLRTAAERQKYRNSKDLRNNLRNNSEISPEISEQRLCFTQIRGQKCGDGTCLFKHDFRLPRKLRLCSGWKSGFCADGQSCLYLHSEFPCRFHYLGLKNVRHDLNTCRYYHGGPLPKEYEEMFLESIDLERHPKSLEMYRNQLIQLKATTSDSTIQRKEDAIGGQTTTEQQGTENCSFTPPTEIVIEKSSVTVVDHQVNDSEVCQQNDQELSDESNDLRIDENTLE